MTRPVGRSQRPPVMQVVHLPLPVRKPTPPALPGQTQCPQEPGGPAMVCSVLSLSNLKLQVAFAERPLQRCQAKLARMVTELPCLGVAGQFTRSSHSLPVEKGSPALLAQLSRSPRPRVTRRDSVICRQVMALWGVWVTFGEEAVSFRNIKLNTQLLLLFSFKM